MLIHNTRVLKSIGAFGVSLWIIGASVTESHAQCRVVDVQKLVPPNPFIRPSRGISMAIDGDLAVVGAPGRPLERSLDPGSAYVLRFDGEQWNEEARLISSDGSPRDRFGDSVAVSGDTILIGAPRDDDNGENSGSAYMFQYVGSSWVQAQKLLSDDGAAGDLFGFSVAVTSDAVLIAAKNDDDNAVSSGSAYAFRFNKFEWVQTQKLVAPDGAFRNFFGARIAVFGDRAGISAVGNDDSAGAVYVYHDDGKEWSLEQKLVAIDRNADDHFGSSVAMFNELVAVGARDDSDLARSAGAAYVFEFDGASWRQIQKLVASDGREADLFGIAISIWSDNIVVGASATDDLAEKSGSAYYFQFDGSIWREQAKLLASDGGGGQYDQLGHSAATLGEHVLLGAFGDHGGEGAIYAYRIDQFDPDSDGILGDCDNCPEHNPRQINRCDLNCDERFDVFDIEPFIDVLFNGTRPCAPCVGDVNQDGTVDALDIEPFLVCLFP